MMPSFPHAVASAIDDGARRWGTTWPRGRSAAIARQRSRNPPPRRNRPMPGRRSRPRRRRSDNRPALSPVARARLPRQVEEPSLMAKKEFAKFVRPDRAAREAEAAKTTRLRALRLAREAEIAEETKAAANREAAAKLAKAQARRRVSPAPPG